MAIIKKIARGIAQTKFASTAINERADLSAFRKKTNGPEFLWNYVDGLQLYSWLAGGSVGGVSIYLREPLLIIIGAPVFLIIAHLMFILGMYLAGGKYFMVFLRWATRIALERLM